MEYTYWFLKGNSLILRINSEQLKVSRFLLFCNTDDHIVRWYCDAFLQLVFYMKFVVFLVFSTFPPYSILLLIKNVIILFLSFLTFHLLSYRQTAGLKQYLVSANGLTLLGLNKAPDVDGNE